MAKVENESFDAKAMLAKANENKTKIRYADRVELKVIKDTKHYRAGKLITPHKLVANELISLGIAKAV
jgi:hypothetical protein